MSGEESTAYNVELDQRLLGGCEVDQDNLDILCVKNAKKKYCEKKMSHKGICGHLTTKFIGSTGLGVK